MLGFETLPSSRSQQPGHFGRFLTAGLIERSGAPAGDLGAAVTDEVREAADSSFGGECPAIVDLLEKDLCAAARRRDIDISIERKLFRYANHQAFIGRERKRQSIQTDTERIGSCALTDPMLEASLPAATRPIWTSSEGPPSAIFANSSSRRIRAGYTASRPSAARVSRRD